MARSGRRRTRPARAASSPSPLPRRATLPTRASGSSPSPPAPWRPPCSPASPRRPAPSSSSRSRTPPASASPRSTPPWSATSSTTNSSTARQSASTAPSACPHADARPRRTTGGRTIPPAVGADRRPTTFGVKALIRHPDGRFLVVRHSYADTRRWALPGGGYKPARETPTEAAAREVREELGILLPPDGFAALDTTVTTLEGKHDTLTILTADALDDAFRLSPEIAEAR